MIDQITNTAVEPTVFYNQINSVESALQVDRRIHVLPEALCHSGSLNNSHPFVRDSCSSIQKTFSSAEESTTLDFEPPRTVRDESELTVLMNKIVNLVQGEDGVDDEGCPLQPTKHAFREVVRFLISRDLIDVITRDELPSIYTDRRGGIRVEWVDSINRLVLSISPSRSASPNHIFASFGKDEEVLFEPSRRHLIGQIGRFIDSSTN